MPRFKLEKNFQEKVIAIVKKEKLKTKKNIKEYIDVRHHTVATPVKVKSGKKFLLRILITADKKKNEAFDKELILYKLFKKSEKIINKPPIAVKSSKKPLKWMLRNFYEGKPTGDFWGFNKNFLTEKNSKFLSSYLISLQAEGKKIIRNYLKLSGANLPSRKAAWFIKDWKKDRDYNPDFIYSKFIKKYFSESEVRKINSILNTNKNLINKYSKFLSHGDLMPQNIFIDKTKKLFFIDWEEVHINNPLFDPAYIYVNAWKNKNWRSAFIKKFIKNYPIKNKKDLWLLADINILIISLRMAEYAHLNLVHKNPIIKQALKKHINNVKKIIN